MSRPREFDVERALHQCMDVFWKKGYKSTSFEDLTRSTRVKKQSLYGAFDGKRALFMKALTLYHQESIANLEKIVSQDVSALKKLENIRDATLFQGDEPSHRGCLMVNSALEFGIEDEELICEVKKMFAEVERIIEMVIRSGQEHNLITTRLPSKELAAHFNNVLMGAKMLEKSGDSREKIEAILNTALTLMLS